VGAHSKMKGLLRQLDSHNMYQRKLEVTEAENSDPLKIAMMYTYFMSQEKNKIGKSALYNVEIIIEFSEVW
jgi:hypothetical protein